MKKKLFNLIVITIFLTTSLLHAESTLNPAKRGMVATQHYLATKAGLEVLQNGGNAVDAAVTTAFTLAVTLPRAGNLGGGGFMLIHMGGSKGSIAIDYREKAPLAAWRDMFLDENGNVDHEKTRYSHLAVGVPGTVAGLAKALEIYGSISLEEALAPATYYAEYGFSVDPDLHQSLLAARPHMRRSKESMQIFYKKSEKPYRVGDILYQADLATSLKLIAKEGPSAFYEGEIAKKIVTDMELNGGLITFEDLRRYKPVIRKPITGTYRGYEIVSMPPPSSGGIHLIQMLNILENFDLLRLGPYSPERAHVMIEAMKRAYADRSVYLGDPDFFDVPVDELISKEYARQIAKEINYTDVTPSSTIQPGIEVEEGGMNTTHFSIADQFGNVVSNTFTLNHAYGSKITVPGTGILLNNEMNDFSAKAGVPNSYGLIGNEGNAIEPEKRMLSSMTPTIVLKDGKPFLVTGSPGGSQIITTVLQVILNVVDHLMPIQKATETKRFHHQWLPDQVIIERGTHDDIVYGLEQRNYEIEFQEKMGNTNSILIKDKMLYGASDNRTQGTLAAGY